MEDCIDSMLESQMAMAKITYTPLPFPYAHMLTCVNYLFIFTLPLVLIAQFGWYVPAICIPFALVVFSTQHIAELMEDPFGNDATDLPITAMFNTLIKEVNDHVKLSQIKFRTKRFMKHQGTYVHRGKTRSPEEYLPPLEKVLVGSIGRDFLPPNLYQQSKARFQTTLQKSADNVSQSKFSEEVEDERCRQKRLELEEADSPMNGTSPQPMSTVNITALGIELGAGVGDDAAIRESTSTDSISLSFPRKRLSHTLSKDDPGSSRWEMDSEKESQSNFAPFHP